MPDDIGAFNRVYESPHLDKDGDDARKQGPGSGTETITARTSNSHPI